jgi:hypothetical protein
MALVARHMVRMPDYKADTLMPLIDQVSRHIVCSLHIIHENRACQRMIGARRDADANATAQAECGGASVTGDDKITPSTWVYLSPPISSASV